MPTIGFRLAVRNAEDTADEYTFTSVPGVDTPTTHPVLTEPPTVDGASADLIAGTVDVGAGTIKFWDELTTVTVPSEDVLYADEFPYPDLAAFEAVWPIDAYSEGGGTTEWSVDGDRAILDIANARVVSGDGALITRGPVTVTGLLPTTVYTISAVIDPGGPPRSSLVIGLISGGSTGTGGHNWVAHGEQSFTQTSSLEGTIRLWLLVTIIAGFDSTDPLTRTIRWDWIRITKPATVTTTGRVMTARLYDVQDAVARLAPLSRRCRIDQQVDGGEWTPFHRGHFNRAAIDGGEVTVTVGDTTRQEQQTELFATLPTLDPASLADPLPIPTPRVGLILGGPIAADATYGTFASIPDFGPTRWKVEEALTDHAGDDRMVRLKFVSGYLRPWFDTERFWFKQDEWEKTNNAGRDYFVWDPAKYESHPYPLSTVNSFGYFPDLVARLDPVGAGAVLEKMPIARPIKHEPDDKHTPKAEYDALTGNDSVLYVDWGPDDPFPAVDDEFDLTLYSPVISDKNPLLLAGHPVDLVAYAAALSGIPWHADSRADAKAALGEGLWCELAIKGKLKFTEFQKALGGFFGFLFRPDLVTGERHFIPTRVRPAAAQFAITNADRIDATDGSGDGQPIVWEVDEDSVVNVVKFATQRYRFFRYKEDSGDPPVTMLAVAEASVEGHRGDTTVNGERTQTYEIPGQLQLRAADGRVSPLILATQDPANPGYAEDAGGVIVDFAGWGVPKTTVLVDAESAAASAQVGDEGTLDLPDLPIPEVGQLPVTARGVDRAHSPRVVRVVKRDPQIGAVQLTLVHAGELSQTAVAAPESGGSTDTGPPTQPTFTLTLHPIYPTQLAVITFTNGADLAADNLVAEIEIHGGLTAPPANTIGISLRDEFLFEDGDATTRDSPVIAPGDTLWVRMRSRGAGLYSDWTDWQAYTTPTVENGGGPGGGPDGGPGGGAYAPARPTFTHSIDGSGSVSVLVNAPGAHHVKLAASLAGTPDEATVRAATAAGTEPFLFEDVFTLAPGQIGYVSAFAYDDNGNESAFATDTVTRGTIEGAPVGAQYLVAAADAGLSAERVTTDTATIAWDHTTAGQAKAIVVDGSITTAKLANTAVTPGSYTSADITVDADGRITAASNGTGGAIPFDLNLGELGDGTNDLTTGEREFIVIVSVEGTVTGWTCDGDVGDVTLDVETAPVVDGVDFVWTTRCTTGSDQRPAFSGTAPTSVTLSGANEFALTGRTALRLTVAAASGGATVVRLAFHGTRS